MENIIAYHCAPALAGIKASNIVTCHKNRGYDVHCEIRRLNSELNCKDIYLEPLCECDRRVLLMVYREKVLGKIFEDSRVQSFLGAMGYGSCNETKEYIKVLKTKFIPGEFPHEIGVFLGYPMEDVYGFMLNGGEDCLLCGDWKVYSNPEEAKRKFERYRVCKAAVIKRIMQGKTLSQMFCAA